MSFHDEEVLGKAYDSLLMRRLLRYLRPYWRFVALALAAIVSGAALQLAQPYLMKVAIDQHIATGDLAGLDRIAVLFLAILLASFALEFVQTWLLQLTGQRIMFDMRMQIYEHLQRLDIGFYDRNPVGRLMTRVTTDVDVLNDLFTAGVVSIFGDIFMLVGITIVLFVMDWRLALVALAVIPLIAIVTQWFRRNARESYRTVRTLIARINAFLQEHITGMSTVQLFRQEARTFERFDAVNTKHRDANVQSIVYYAVFYPAIEVIGALAAALIIWFGGGWTMQGTLTLGSLVAFLQYSQRFFRPISDMSEKFNVLQAAMASSERIFKLLDTEVRIASPSVPILGSGRGQTPLRPSGVRPRSDPQGSDPAPTLRGQTPLRPPGVRPRSDPQGSDPAPTLRGQTPLRPPGVRPRSDPQGSDPAPAPRGQTPLWHPGVRPRSDPQGSDPAPTPRGQTPLRPPGVRPRSGTQGSDPAPTPRGQTPLRPGSDPGVTPGSIVFDDVSFAYNGTDCVLRNVSFEVKPGERVGIVGATGAGKSTLINLLLRFYDVTSGRILVDGVDVRSIDLQALRAKFSLVLQDVHLFSGTVSSNIRLGNSAISDDAVRDAAAAVHAAAFIERLPNQYGQAVAERGATLSVGQKQLLSFARALAFDPEILILDEATSSVDTETELTIRDALKVLMAGRTTLAIAHRLSTIQDMDKILVLHRGELRESGTHQQLLASRGIYYKLYQLQFKEQEKQPVNR